MHWENIMFKERAWGYLKSNQQPHETNDELEVMCNTQGICTVYHEMGTRSGVKWEQVQRR